jgi:glycosyltransferase involved in cell wall biosynthesis
MDGRQMIKVLLNCQAGTRGESATARYVRALASSLPDCSDALSLSVFDYYWRIVPFASTQKSAVRAKKTYWFCPPRVGDRIHQIRKRYPVLAPTQYDVMHLPDDTNVFFRSRATVSTLHMAGPLQRPDLYDPTEVARIKKWVSTSLKRSDKLITVSEHLRQTLIETYHYPPERLCTIPLGVGEQFVPGQSENKGPPSILYVGRIRAAKNVQAVCAVYAALKKDRFPDLVLRLAGRSDVSQTQIFEWMSCDANAMGSLEMVGFFPPESQELVSLYQRSSVLLFPSYAEGWTSPPLEAMRCGIPVVVSDISSLPETVGSAAIRVHPDRHREMGDAVESLLVDQSLRREYIRRGLQWAAQFTWARTARETFQLYKTLA